MQILTFSWLDYVIFITLLGTSLIIGVYFGFFSKQDTTNEYLYGGKKMGYFPVAVSLLSSFLSGITFLGLPTEIYYYGASYLTLIFGEVIVALVTIYIFLPVFFKLQLSNANEYLELRFSKQVRKFSSLVYFIGLVLITSVIIYVPALAFSQITQYPVHVITPLLTIICITYTSMGGVKAVIWTDTFQFIFTVIGVSSVLGIGIYSAGGISEVWKISAAGNRTQLFNMSPSMYERNSFLAIQVSLVITTISRFSVGQKFVQKFLSVRVESDAKKSIIVMLVGWIILTVICCLTGLVMYAKYSTCDPMKALLVNHKDQTLVYFVLDVAGHIPGLPGIFLAGIVSSSLSTLSACFNTLSGLFYDDFIAGWISNNRIRESIITTIMKANVVLFGIFAIALVFLIERLGTVFQLIFTIGSILDGPIFTLFIMGMLMPFIGKKGALVGGYSSLIFMIWLVVGSQWHIINNRVQFKQLPTSTEKCEFSINSTTSPPEIDTSVNDEDKPFFLFRISMMYFTFVGGFFGILIGTITSYVTKEMGAYTINPDLVSPVIRRFLPKRRYVEVALNELSRKNEETLER